MHQHPSDMHLQCLHAAVRAAQLRHYAPLHRSLTFHLPAGILASCGDWSRAGDRGCHRDNRRLVSTQLNRRLLDAGPEEGVPPRFWTVSLAMHLRAKWLIEIGELVSISKAESSELKLFLS